MTFCYLDIFKTYGYEVQDAHNNVINPWGIHTFSSHLMSKITNVMYTFGDQSAPKKIDIVGHSLGGIIATHMVLNNRDILESWYGAQFNSVVTLGSPHLGTTAGTLCNSTGNGPCYTTNTNGIYNLVARQLNYGSMYMEELHGDTANWDYSGINWFMGAAPNDGLIDINSALAIGIDDNAGIIFERSSQSLLNHFLISGIKFLGCADDTCKQLDTYREEISDFLSRNF